MNNFVKNQIGEGETIAECQNASIVPLQYEEHEDSDKF